MTLMTLKLALHQRRAQRETARPPREVRVLPRIDNGLEADEPGWTVPDILVGLVAAAGLLGVAIEALLRSLGWL